MRIILFFYLVLLTSGLMAQNHLIIDSLQLRLSKSTNDSLKAKIYFELNKEWAEYSFDSAIHYAHQGMSISEKLNHTVLIARGINAQGLAYDYQNQFDSALYYYESSEAYARDHDDMEGRARAILNMGAVYTMTGQLDLALDMFNVATDLYTKLGQVLFSAKVMNNQALIYRRTKRYEMAKEMLTQALAIYQKDGNKNQTINALINLAGVYQLLTQYDSAIIIAKKSLSVAKDLQNEELYAQSLVTIGKCFTELNQLDSAFINYQRAEHSISENGSFNSKAYVYMGMATYYLAMMNNLEAKKYLDRVAALPTIDENVDIALSYYQMSAQYYRSIGNWKKAYTQLSVSINMQEAYLDQKIAERTAEMEQVFKMEQREWKIERLQAKSNANELKIEKQDQYTTGLIIISILALVLCTFLIIILRQRKQRHQLQKVLLEEEIDGLRLRIGKIVSDVKLDEVALDKEKINSESPNSLTEREVQILQLAITNKTNAEIAEEIFLSVNTVKYHLKHVYNKLGVSSRLEAREVLSKII